MAISDEEAQKLVIGVLFEVGWRKDDIAAILMGPYEFQKRVRADSHVMHNYDPHKIMRQNLGRGTEICGQCNSNYGETLQAHVRGLGSSTEQLKKRDEE